ncbi:hypothetical protein [Aerosakkonema funiforme]|uniref:hypothetical protein n=1 Tax=Aerosakkonema funiforme TaxID=1246630 RepID=UPI0035B7CB8D
MSDRSSAGAFGPSGRLSVAFIDPCLFRLLLLMMTNCTTLMLEGSIKRYIALL